MEHCLAGSEAVKGAPGQFLVAGPTARRLSGVRLRVEFTTEPFDLDEAPAHAVVARDVVTGAELDAVDVGPFGNTAEGDVHECVLGVLALETSR